MTGEGLALVEDISTRTVRYEVREETRDSYIREHLTGRTSTFVPDGVRIVTRTNRAAHGAAELLVTVTVHGRELAAGRKRVRRTGVVLWSWYAGYDPEWPPPVAPEVAVEAVADALLGDHLATLDEVIREQTG